MTGFKKYVLFVFMLVFISVSCYSQKNWKEIVTADDVCSAFPGMMKGMMDQLNLEYPGLEKVKSAYETGNLTSACELLIGYYLKSGNAPHLRIALPAITGKTDAEADTILKNVFVIQNVRGQVPFGADGHRDWYYKGPNNDAEWAWLSNRHSQLSYVFSVWLETGNPKYAEYIDLFLRDFIIKSMPYPGVKSGTSVWRGLEVAARAKVWSRIFYGMLQSNYLSPATRLLILGSLPDHAHYSRNFHGGNNWLTMEISALATIATNFPEYKKSDEWLGYSVQAMTESMKDQVYPDGVQTELTAHYHNVSLANFELFKDICDQAGKTLPEFFNTTIEKMYRYITLSIRPDGSRILNNDGDRGSNISYALRGAELYNHKDWEYIATNGKSGVRPSVGPSFFFPWAGQLISRSGYETDAHWSFFDVGPWGSGHQHNDKMHISISAYGRDLLVDAGRFAYTGQVAAKFRRYACGSAGHNVLLFDGKGQGPGPTHAKKPLDDKSYRITPDFDYATGSFNDYMQTEGKVSHTRAVFYVRGKFWVVADHLITDRPRNIEALWHWHPSCVVKQEGMVVKTANAKGNLAVIPVGGRQFDIQLVKGQEYPEIQGWYSPEYNAFEPNVASRYSINIGKNTTLVWILVPSLQDTPETTAEILSENDREISLKIGYDNENIEVTLPFFDSSRAAMKKR